MIKHIAIGFGDFVGTTGQYFERSFNRDYQVTYVGTPWKDRPGYAPDEDLADLLNSMSPKPDLFVYIDSGSVHYFPRGLEKLEMPTIGYLIDAYPPETGLSNKMRLRLAPFFDYLFVANAGCIDLYSSGRDNMPVRWLPLACDPEVQKDHQLERIYDVGFVGSTGGPYDERGQALNLLSSKYTMNDFSRPYYGDDMARVYSQSKIVFNITLGRILNMRIFEVPPCGALLLTKRANNGQNELFREGDHFDTFETLEELDEKVAYYLAHPAEREALARAGQDWALQNHTYQQRAESMIQTVLDNPQEKLTAPARKWTDEQVLREYTVVHSMLRLVDASFTNVTLARRHHPQVVRQAVWELTKALGRRAKYG
ncbi:MAG: glycosyltransferase [Ardenticatenaceae bacterium]|nr:glycosyltransferase [Ardenticatenaceae bacterium]